MGTIIHRVTAISCQDENVAECEQTIIDSGLKYFRYDCELNGYVQFLIPSTGGKLGFGICSKYELALAKLRLNLNEVKCEFISVGYGSDFENL